MRKTTQPLRTALAGTTLLALITTANGAGFQLAERSAIGMGRAFSGEAAIADDASVIASNPAGMSLLDDMSFSIGASYIRGDVDVSGVSPSSTTSPGGGSPSSRNVIPEAVVPHTYFSKRINDQITIGVGTFVGYGLKSDYSSAFAAESGTDYSELTTVNFNPAIAYRFNDQFTLGAGFNVMYAKGNITSRTSARAADDAGAAFLTGSDLFDLEGDDFAFGYNVGILYELSNQTRIGLHYRSSIDLDIEGTAKLGAAFGPFAGEPDATLDVTLPETIELSIYHEINDRFAVHGDVLWTRWSRFEELAPTTGLLIDPALRVDESWSDTFRYSIGATYHHSDKLTLRCGVAYDQSPVDDAHRTLRIPDADRIWASIGASYMINECYTCDIGYTHIFADDANINTNEDFFNGTASGDVNLLSVGVHGSF